jgi:hypothetical protein
MMKPFATSHRLLPTASLVLCLGIAGVGPHFEVRYASSAGSPAVTSATGVAEAGSVREWRQASPDKSKRALSRTRRSAPVRLLAWAPATKNLAEPLLNKPGEGISC